VTVGAGGALALATVAGTRLAATLRVTTIKNHGAVEARHEIDLFRWIRVKLVPSFGDWPDVTG